MSLSLEVLDICLLPWVNLGWRTILMGLKFVNKSDILFTFSLKATLDSVTEQENVCQQVKKNDTCLITYAKRE